MPRPRNAQPIADAWQFCPRCGAESAQCGSNPFACNRCDYAHYFGPCAAVGGIVTDRDGQVLLLIRGKDPGRGMYGIPGGFIDQNETAEEALRREILEETQLEITSCRYLCSFPNSYDYRGVTLPVMDLFFHVQVNGFDNLQAQEGEIDGWRFCDPGPDDLNRLAFESNRRALEHFLNRHRPAGED